MKSVQEHEIVAAMRDWLTATSDVEIATGLSREEARGRAGELLAAIAAGSVRSEDVDAEDDDLKDVLWALVEHLDEKEVGTPTFQECARAYQFVTALSLEHDPFEELDDVRHRIATIGWRSSPGGLETVLKARSTIWEHDDERRHRDGSESADQLSPSVRALRTARQYISTPEEHRSEGFRKESLSSCHVLLTICKILRHTFESRPAVALKEASALYRWVTDSVSSSGLFDEREYLQGATALISAKASRLLGKLTDADGWLDCAAAAFRRTVNPAPLIAGVAFERLAVRYSSGRFEETLELLPSLKSSFKKLDMAAENAKTQFLEAITLKALGRVDEHFALLQGLEEAAEVRGCPSLHGQVLVHIGNHEAALGQFEAAASTYEKALPVVMRGNRPVALCELKWSIGEAYRSQGSLGKAVEAFRVARNDYQALGFQGFVTHLSLVIAESLLALGRDREAEWEILSALPSIEAEKMVPEGIAAVALLRESVRRRKTDPNALRELREQLQAKKGLRS